MSEEKLSYDLNLVEEEKSLYKDSILQATDVLTLQFLDDDDTTQSSTTIQEDSSYVFFPEEEIDDEDSIIFQDAHETSSYYPATFTLLCTTVGYFIPERTKRNSSMPEENPIDDMNLEEEESLYTHSIIQAPDVLALQFLDDDDTTQSSTTIQEDSSYFFFPDEDDHIDDDDSIFQDYQETSSYPAAEVAVQVYETAKYWWFRGKSTMGVGALFQVTEGACQTVAHMVGIQYDSEPDVVLTRSLQALDHALAPVDATVSNLFWQGTTTPTTTAAAAAARKPAQIQVSFSPFFEDDNDDDDMWIPLDRPPPTLAPKSSGMQEESSHPPTTIAFAQ
jgi:hypothetical protein